MWNKSDFSPVGTSEHSARPTPWEGDERSVQALQNWEHLFEHASWGIVLLGVPGISMRAVNLAYAQMHGYTIEELTGRPVV